MKYITKSFINEIILSEINLLLENRIDFLKTNLLPKIKSNFGNSNEFIFNKLLDIDPTLNKQYLQWLINQYVKIQDDKTQVYNFWNNSNDLKSNLDIFNRNKQNLEDSNINNYNIESFNNAVNKIKQKPENLVKGLEKTEKYSELKIGDVDGFSIYKIPKGRTDLRWAGIGLGKGTTWCTAYDTDDGKNTFEDYINKSDLIIMINNSNPSEKYQYHASSDQFMDKNDKDVDISKFNNIFKNLFEKKIINLSRIRKLFLNIPLTKEELFFDKDLDLSETSIELIPDNLIINGDLNLSYTKIKILPNNLIVNGSLNLSNTQIKVLPINLIVKKDLDLSETSIELIPDNLIINGKLDLSHTKIIVLPNKLTVKGDLIISKTSIDFLPKDLNVGGDIYTNKKYISHNNILNYLGKYLY